MSRQVKKVNISGKEDKSNKVSSWSNTTTDAHYPSEKLVKDSLDGKANSTHNHTKSQITDFPTIPSKTSDLTNDSGFLTSHQDISGKEDTSNKVSSWRSTTTDTHYPSEKLVKDSLDAKANSNHTHRIFDIDNISHTGTNALIEDCDYNNEGFGFADGLLIFNQQNYKLYYDKNSGADSDTGNELATLSNIPSPYDIINIVNIALGHIIDNWDDYQ